MGSAICCPVVDGSWTYDRAYAAFRKIGKPIDRYIFLRDLYDAQPAVYYALLLTHTEEVGWQSNGSVQSPRCPFRGLTNNCKGCILGMRLRVSTAVLRQLTSLSQRHMCRACPAPPQPHPLTTSPCAPVAQVLPYIYTPTVGEACQKYHALPLKTHGLFLSLNDRGRILEKMRAWPQQVGRLAQQSRVFACTLIHWSCVDLFKCSKSGSGFMQRLLARSTSCAQSLSHCSPSASEALRVG